VLYFDQATQRYYQCTDPDNLQWIERSRSWVKREVIDKKAYIDMPNLTYFTFLYPLDLTFGLKLSF